MEFLQGHFGGRHWCPKMHCCTFKVHSMSSCLIGMTWWQRQKKSFVFECDWTDELHERGLSMHRPCWGWNSHFLKDLELRDKKGTANSLHRSQLIQQERTKHGHWKVEHSFVLPWEEFKLHSPDGFQHFWHKVCTCVLTAYCLPQSRRGR